MNMSSSEAESSNKRQENGDLSIGSDRPLKKARFAWQVKGKYHLKNELSEAKPSTNERDVAGSSNKDNGERAVSTEQNIEILGDYLLKQDFNNLESVIADPDRSLIKHNTDVVDPLQSPRYVSPNISSYGALSPNDSLSDNCEMVSVPLSMLHDAGFAEDQCIARWQAKQVAKAFIDNTINRVLDTWMVIPMSAEQDNRKSVAIDIAEFINNLPGDNSIENEGILMAISAHGLQNNNSNNEDNFSTEQACNSSSLPDTFPSSPPCHQLTDDEDSVFKVHEPKQNETDGSTYGSDISWSLEHDVRSVDDAGLAFVSDISTASNTYIGQNDRPNNMELDYQLNDNANIEIDFFDAAISFAIQNRGLTSYGTDYG